MVDGLANSALNEQDTVMRNMPNVVVVLACCGQYHRPFGIRFEELTNRQWVGDWAFPIAEASAKRERYDRSEIRGGMGFSQAYPGCPYCGLKSIVRCNRCGGVSCLAEESQTFACPYCGSRGEVNGRIESLTSGGDR